MTHESFASLSSLLQTADTCQYPMLALPFDLWRVNRVGGISYVLAPLGIAFFPHFSNSLVNLRNEFQTKIYLTQNIRRTQHQAGAEICHF